MPIYHKKTATLPDQPGAEVNAPEWNDSHTNPDIADVTGLQSALDGKATSAQASLADSALQSGDNISELNNDVGYVTATLSREQVEDYAGEMIAAGGTKTLIAVTYQDSTNDMDF